MEIDWPTLAHRRLRLRPRLSAAKTMKRKQATNFTCFPSVSEKLVPTVPIKDDLRFRKLRWRREKISCCPDPCSGRSGARSSSVTDRHVNNPPGGKLRELGLLGLTIALTPVICWQIIRPIEIRARLRLPGMVHISFMRTQPVASPTSLRSISSWDAISWISPWT